MRIAALVLCLLISTAAFGAEAPKVDPELEKLQTQKTILDLRIENLQLNYLRMHQELRDQLKDVAGKIAERSKKKEVNSK